MIRRNTQIVLLVFGILIVLVFALRRAPGPTEETFPMPTADALAFLTFTEQDVIAIQVEDSEGAVALVERGEEEGEWALVEPETPIEETDAATIQTAVRQAANLTALSAFAEVPSPEALGLDAPQYTVTITLEDKEEIVILVGDVTPPDTGYYVQVNGEVTVVVGKFGLDPILDLLREPPILGTPTPLPETATIEAMTPSAEATGEGTIDGGTPSPEATEETAIETGTPTAEATEDDA